METLPLLNSNQISHSDFTSSVTGFACNFSASWRRAGSDTSEMGRRAGELQDRMVAGLAAESSCQGWNRRSACRLAANYLGLQGRYIPRYLAMVHIRRCLEALGITHVTLAPFGLFPRRTVLMSVTRSRSAVMCGRVKRAQMSSFGSGMAAVQQDDLQS